MPRGVRIRRAALTLLGLSVAVGVLYAGVLPCLFAKLTHHPCPGCGSSRACLALLEGDVHGVLVFNPFGPATAILLLILAAQMLVSILRWGDIRDAGAGRLGTIIKRMFYVVAVLEVGLWVARMFGLFGGPVPV